MVIKFIIFESAVINSFRFNFVVNYGVPQYWTYKYAQCFCLPSPGVQDTVSKKPTGSKRSGKSNAKKTKPNAKKSANLAEFRQAVKEKRKKRKFDIDGGDSNASEEIPNSSDSSPLKRKKAKKRGFLDSSFSDTSNDGMYIYVYKFVLIFNLIFHYFSFFSSRRSATIGRV